MAGWLTAHQGDTLIPHSKARAGRPGQAPSVTSINGVSLQAPQFRDRDH